MTHLLFDLGPYLIAMAIAMARPLGLIASASIFNWFEMGNVQRYSLAFVFSIISVNLTLHFLEVEQLSFLQIIAVLLIEYLIGLAFGVAISIPIFGAQLAGDYVDQYRVSSVASDFDTTQNIERTTSGKLFTLIALALFVGAGGIQASIAAIYASYGIWPLASTMPEFTYAASSVLFQLLDMMFRIGLIIAAPIMIPLIIIDIGLVFATRAGQQFNPFDLSLTLKNLVFILILLPVMGPIIYALNAETATAVSLGTWVLEALSE